MAATAERASAARLRLARLGAHLTDARRAIPAGNPACMLARRTAPAAGAAGAASAGVGEAACFVKLEAWVADLVRSGRLHGCSYAVGLRGRLLTSRGAGCTPPVAGEATLPPDTPVAADTVFITASVTKPLVGIAIMQLAEQGRLDIEAAVAAFVPAFAQAAAGRHVSVRHLLCHTGGLQDTFHVARLGNPNPYIVDRNSHPSLAHHTRAICGEPLLLRSFAAEHLQSAPRLVLSWVRGGACN